VKGATMEMIVMRIDKPEFDPIVKARKWMEYGAIEPMSCESGCVSVKSI
jgi:hypothetical protein